MFFLNLSLPEFLTLLATASAAIVTLYLLDRQRRKIRVPTLRFFKTDDKPPQMKHRRKIQQPLSLLLQLLSLLLLLLAIAQLRLGSPDQTSRDHVLLLDSSAWMGARTGNARLIDQARAKARAYVKALPRNDRVMVVRAGEVPMPATLFESDRAKIERAISNTQPGSSALNIEQAMDFAAQAEKLRARRSGEIVFIGAGRVPGEGAASMQLPSNLRIIPVEGSLENCGLRKVGVRRSLTNPDMWEVFIAAKNYGTEPRSVPLVVQFGGGTVGTKRFMLNPGAEDTAAFQFKGPAAGWLDARLMVRDAFPQDDRAIMELPARQSLAVTIYSDEPDLLRPVFNAIPGVKAAFLPTARFDSNGTTGIVFLDRFAPSTPPKVNTVWVQPPAKSSPIPVDKTVAKTKLVRWHSSHALGTGLRAKNIEIDNTEVFKPAPDDIAIADSEGGPVMVGRDGKTKTVVLGFHPAKSALKYELATPLLFANILHWMAPDIFRMTEFTAGSVGMVSLDLESEPDPSTIRVMAEDGQTMPFSLSGRNLRFFADTPGIVRVTTGERELVYSLTLPQAGETVWNPTSARHGIPSSFPSENSSQDLWQLLALLGLAGLVTDWILFGRRSRVSVRRPASSSRSSQKPRAKWRKAS